MTRLKEIKDEQERLHSFNDEPVIEYGNGDKAWYHHGELHRDNGPAVVKSNGNKLWYRHGNLHRENGPAVIRSNGDKLWYHNGTKYTLHEWIKLSSLSEEHKVELLLSHDY